MSFKVLYIGIKLFFMEIIRVCYTSYILKLFMFTKISMLKIFTEGSVYTRLSDVYFYIILFLLVVAF